MTTDLHPEATHPETSQPESRTLRLVWPQWQGAAADNVAQLVPELPLPDARRGYAVGSAVLAAILPPHDGPTATVPVDLSDAGTQERDGVEAKDAVLAQLGAALKIIQEHSPDRIVTLGGECSTSIAPFTALASRYGDDLAVVWIDAHPDVDTPQTDYPGHHAMALAAITGHGDPDVQALLPATMPPERVALAGMHAWTDDAYPHLAAWGIEAFGPDDLRATGAPLLDWLASTGCSRVAIHLDVDVVDSDEVVLGLGAEPGGLRTDEVRRLVHSVQATADVVGLTVAEFVPRQVLRLRRLLAGFPLL